MSFFVEYIELLRTFQVQSCNKLLPLYGKKLPCLSGKDLGLEGFFLRELMLKTVEI